MGVGRWVGRWTVFNNALKYKYSKWALELSCEENLGQTFLTMEPLGGVRTTAGLINAEHSLIDFLVTS